MHPSSKTLILALALVLLALGACAAASSSELSDGGNPDAATSVRPDAGQSMGPDAMVCPGDPCQILPQCGCSDGACDLDNSNLAEGSAICREVVIAGDVGAACASLLECASGYLCLGGQCRVYCDDAHPCGNGQCLVQPKYDSGGGVFKDIPGVSVCTKNCSPEKSVDNGCPGSPQFGCHLVNFDPNPNVQGDDFYYSDCRTAPATGGGDGTNCAATGDPGCRAGFECVTLGVDTVCKQLCLVPGGACGVGTCSSFGTPISIDGVEYGVCL